MPAPARYCKADGVAEAGHRAEVGSGPVEDRSRQDTVDSRWAGRIAGWHLEDRSMAAAGFDPVEDRSRRDTVDRQKVRRTEIGPAVGHNLPNIDWAAMVAGVQSKAAASRNQVGLDLAEGVACFPPAERLIQPVRRCHPTATGSSAAAQGSDRRMPDLSKPEYRPASVHLRPS